MALSEEEKAKRRANRAASEGAPINWSESHYMDRWRKEGALSTVETITHLGSEPIREVRRHSYSVPVIIPARAAGNGYEARPEKKILLWQPFRCWQNEKFWVGFYKARCKKLGDWKGPLECPLCRLIRHAQVHHFNDVVLSFGRGCVTKEGNPTSVVEVTGSDLAGCTEGRTAYQRSMVARGMKAAIVIPYRFGQADALEEAECKIAVESYTMFDAQKDAVDAATRDFGEDEADPACAPAIYRWTSDPDKTGEAMYRANYCAHLKAPPAFVAAFEAPADPAVVQTLHDDVLAYGNAEQAVEDLALSLREPRIDLKAVMLGGKAPQHVQESRASKRAKREQEKAQEGEAKEAAPSASTSRRGPANGAAPAKKDERPGEPCGECGTFWPVGEAYCPGRATKACTCVDPDYLPKDAAKPAEREPGSDDDDGDPIKW